VLTVLLLMDGRPRKLVALTRYVSAWPFTLARAANWARPFLSWLTSATVCQEEPRCT
jgi:hypothetical protein